MAVFKACHIPLPNRRPSFAVVWPFAYRERDGAFSFEGVPPGEKANWSSELCEAWDASDACDVSDELDGIRRCRGRRFGESGSVQEKPSRSMVMGRPGEIRRGLTKRAATSGLGNSAERSP